MMGSSDKYDGPLHTLESPAAAGSSGVDTGRGSAGGGDDVSRSSASRNSLPDAAAAGGWSDTIGLAFVVATPGEVVAEWTIADRHKQPHGIVHGGVYASVVETCCSVGALLAAPPGKGVVGVENHTSFIRPVRDGRLRARAVPLHAGRRAQLWECSIIDESQRLIATGRLRVLCVDVDGERER